MRALDEGAERIGDTGGKVIHKLAKEWSSLSDEEKRELMETIVAIASAIGVAVTAFRESGSKKKKAKAVKAVKKAGRKALKKAAATAGVKKPLQKDKKK